MSFEDKAQEHDALVWSQINAAPRASQVTYAPGDAGYGPEDCVDCEGEVPPLRRAHGWRRCTACESAREIAARRLGRR